MKSGFSIVTALALNGDGIIDGDDLIGFPSQLCALVVNPDCGFKVKSAHFPSR
jgi:hypothetical protein